MNRPGVKRLLEGGNGNEVITRKRLRNLKTKTLLIWGKGEKLFLPEHLEWFKANVPSQVKILEPEGIGHVPMLEAPKWFIQAIEEFWKTSTQNP